MKRRSKYTYIPKDEISEVITFNNVSFESDDLLDGAYVKGRKKYARGGNLRDMPLEEQAAEAVGYDVWFSLDAAEKSELVEELVRSGMIIPSTSEVDMKILELISQNDEYMYMADGGMMADGGEIEVGDYVKYKKAKYHATVIDVVNNVDIPYAKIEYPDGMIVRAYLQDLRKIQLGVAEEYSNTELMDRMRKEWQEKHGSTGSMMADGGMMAKGGMSHSDQMIDIMNEEREKDIYETKRLITAFIKKYGHVFPMNEKNFMNNLKPNDYLGYGASSYNYYTASSNIGDKLEIGETKPKMAALWLESDINPNGISGKDDIARTYQIHLEIKGKKRLNQRSYDDDGLFFKIYDYGRSISEVLEKVEEKMYQLETKIRKYDLRLFEVLESGGYMADGGVATTGKFKVKYYLKESPELIKEKIFDDKDKAELFFETIQEDDDIMVSPIEEMVMAAAAAPKKSLFASAKPAPASTAAAKKKRERVQVDGIADEISRYDQLKAIINNAEAEKELIGGRLKEIGRDKFMDIYEDRGFRPPNFDLADGNENILLEVKDMYLKVEPEKAAILEQYSGIIEVKTTYNFNSELLEKEVSEGMTIGDVVSMLIQDSKLIPDSDKENLIKAETKIKVAKGTIDRLLDYDNPREIFNLISPILALK